MLKGKSYFESRVALCDFLAIVCLASCVTALFSIGGVGFNRYLHICHPNAYTKVFSLRKNVAYCGAFWLAGLGLSLPTLVGWSDNVYDHKYMECIWNRLHSLSFTVFFSSCIVALPVCIIAFSYVSIFLHVHASKKRVGTMSVKNNLPTSDQPRGLADQTHFRNGRSATASSLKLAKTLFIIFVVFVLCWTPYALLVVCDFDDKLPTELHLFVLLLAHMHSTLNCIVYAVTNNHFRTGYGLVVQRLTCCSLQLRDFSSDKSTSPEGTKPWKNSPAAMNVVPAVRA